MLPLLVLIFVPILTALLPLKKENGEKLFNSIRIFFVFLFILLALRGSMVGNDTSAYITIFTRISGTPWNALLGLDSEIGFVILTKLVSYITSNSQIYLAIIAFLVVLPMYLTFSNKNINPVLFIALFVVMPTFAMMFSGLRQALAISIGTLVYKAAKEKQIVKALVFCFIAFFFHRSALIMLLIIPACLVRIQKKHLPLIVIAFFVVLIFNRPIFVFFGNVFGEIYDFSFSETNAYAMLILFALLLIFSFFICDDNDLDNDTISLRNILVIACLLQCFVPLNPLAMRMNYYFIIFIPFEVCSIVSVAKSSSNQLRKLATVCEFVMCGFFLVYFLINLSTGQSALNIFPYHFFWELV